MRPNESHPLLRRTLLAAGSLFLLLGGALSLGSCASTGVSITLSGTIHTPLGDVHWRLEKVFDGQPRLTFESDDLIGHCVRLRWFDAEGNVTGSHLLEFGENGRTGATGPMGAARWQLEVSECPNHPGATAGPTPLPPSPRGGPATRAAGELRDVLVLGAPLVPRAAPGVTNRTFCLLVEARGFEDAAARVRPLLAGGPGTPVPVGVRVLWYSTLEAISGGLRWTQAQPGRFETWSLAVNGGAFAADLDQGAATYPLGEWELVETVIPSEALALDGPPGSLLRNDLAASFRTDRSAMQHGGTFSDERTAP